MQHPQLDLTYITRSESRPGYMGTSDSQWRTGSEQEIPTAFFVTLV